VFEVKVEWLNHTGFVVSDMERSLAFYRDLLGLEEERNQVVESDYLSQVVGYPDAKLHIVYLGLGDLKHSVELIQYIRPEGDGVAPVPRNYVGAAHLGIIVDDLDATYKELSSKGVKFVSAPAVRPDAQYPWAQKACYLEDPDGN
jgi:catechol 2,3-dioxygenase-like lactoylglutathione lyase family enzyme